MTIDSVTFGSPGWTLPVALILAVTLGLLVVAYRRASCGRPVRIGAGLLKAAALVLLGLCLLEPLAHGRRPRPGANLFVVATDDSESLTIQDDGDELSRGERLRGLLDPEAPWRHGLDESFDVREFRFSSRLEAVRGFEGLSFQGETTALGRSLATVARRYQGLPLAGVLLFTDGIAADLEDEALDLSKLPPIYPVPVGLEDSVRDVAVERVAVRETLFESTPVTIQAVIAHQGCDGEEVTVRVLNESGEELETRSRTVDDSPRFSVRFQLHPEGPGVHVYRVHAALRGELDPPVQLEGAAEAVESSEVTLKNNSRVVVVNRKGGPYRVLYVSGRPNWEFKFLRRALQEDAEVELVGLIRIARREPKFDFRSRYGESTNPLFRGFGNEDDEEAERYDQPVLLRMGTEDDEELRDGFPKQAEDLFRYDGIIVDDLEAAFFTGDQLGALRTFVSRRGGGFLMLGGQESFTKGKYRRTPVGELLPVYLDAVPAPPRDAELRWSLTREGWIQPWIRLRETEDEDRRRLERMPPFRTLNPVPGIKPGASILAGVSAGDGVAYPALVTQPFGRGRAGALLVGDFWRWSLRRGSTEEDDQATAVRQTVRWLVSDVPRRVEVEARPGPWGGPIRLKIQVRDASFEPLDNASVAVEIVGPEGSSLELTADASETEVGRYEASYTPRRAGPYEARVSVLDAGGEEVGSDVAAWSSDPAPQEFRRVSPDRELLEQLARDTGGELVSADALEDFVDSLALRSAPVTDPVVSPLWHRWWMWSLIVLLLVGEWTLRRWKGLP